MDRLWSCYGGISPGLAVRLLILPVVLSVVDFSVTLAFQPESYWEGNRETVLEANPIARWVLLAHPVLIIPAMVAWFVLMFPLVFRTPAKIGLRVIALHLLGHLIAISGWLIRMREDGVWWVGFLILVTVYMSGRILGPFRDQWNSSRPVRSLYSEDELGQSHRQ